MAMYNPATDTGYVRLLISDTGPDEFLFEDEEIDRFIEIERDLKFAAASALYVLAASEVLISKKIRTQDLQTDGPAVANALRALAAQLRKEALWAEEDDVMGTVAIAPFHPYDNDQRPELTEWPWI